MLLLCDVGNTNTIVGLWDGQGAAHRWRISTDFERTADECRLLLRSMLAEYAGPVDGGCLSSVVPQRTESWREALSPLIDGRLVVVGPGVKTGIALSVDNPREVGADRVANAIGAVRLLGAPVIVVDFGTATTVDLVGPDGSYRGGAIAPGLEVSADALVTHTAALRRVELVAPRSPVGRSTVEAIQSGLIYGYAGLVDGLVERILAQVEVPVPVVATGGLAPIVVAHTRLVKDVEPDLTLMGLAEIFALNQSGSE
ncbi:MAG TPA: type III pantothenate kinase [Acidimicrobiia bacterium]|jgi:type III pantothenate kinase|nr:type III pantothenate kinase [Acidimicrobiia bacterium]